MMRPLLKRSSRKSRSGNGTSSGMADGTVNGVDGGSSVRVQRVRKSSKSRKKKHKKHKKHKKDHRHPVKWEGVDGKGKGE